MYLIPRITAAKHSDISFFDILFLVFPVCAIWFLSEAKKTSLFITSLGIASLLFKAQINGIMFFRVGT